jgi:hypothetical protein
MIDIFGDGRYLSVNILGHAAGVLIFGIFLVLVVLHRSRQQLRATRLSLVAAALALIWNAGSLGVILLGNANPRAQTIVAGASFCALTLIPAILLHLCLDKRLPLVVRTGYGLSTLATLAHVVELFRDADNFHRLGLAIISIGFGLLSIVSVLAILWSGAENPRSLSMRMMSAMSLFLFAVSFAHFSGGRSPDAWSMELAVHHGGIPLALFIIMQDYRFVLVDAFVRFLVNVAVAVSFALFTAYFVPRLSFPERVLLIGGALSAFAISRGFLQRKVSRVLFRQPDIERVMDKIRGLSALDIDETSYIEQVTGIVSAALHAQVCRADFLSFPARSDLSLPALSSADPSTKALQDLGAEVIVPVSAAPGNIRYILLGPRAGGRRYLSEDLELLARIASCASQQLEVMRAAETRQLVAQAELRALQSQIHPHFLFNAFNALYGSIPREASGARKTLLNLTEIFRYLLQSGTAFVSLEEELRIIKAYLEIEKLRLRDKLRIGMDVETAALQQSVPILSIQPLVENAVKYGVAASPNGGEVGIQVKLEGSKLRVRVQDSGPGFQATRAASHEHTGVGLDNVSRRLGLYYGPEVQLEIDSQPGRSIVSFAIPCQTKEAQEPAPLAEVLQR